MKKNVSAELLKEYLHYCADSGVFTWLVSPSPMVHKGDIAGCCGANGYVSIGFRGKRYYAHRLAWLYVYGDMPSEQIDHINHDRKDNRINNLRAVSNQDNHRNETKSKNNKSGLTGVTWSKERKKWCANIKVDYRQIPLGRFINFLDAACARKSAEVKYSFHKNHGGVRL